MAKLHPQNLLTFSINFSPIAKLIGRHTGEKSKLKYNVEKVLEFNLSAAKKAQIEK